MFDRIGDDSCCWWRHSAVSDCFQSEANVRGTFFSVLELCTKGSTLPQCQHSRRVFTEKSGFCCSNLAISFKVTGNFIPEISKLFKSLAYCDGLCACSTTGFRTHERQYREFLSSFFLIFNVAFLLWIYFGSEVCVDPPILSYDAIFDWQSKIQSSLSPDLCPSWISSNSLIIIIIIIIIWFGDTVTVTHLTKCDTYSKVRAMSA